MRNAFAALMLLVCTSAAGADPKDWAYGVEPVPAAYANAKLVREPLEILLSKEGVNRFCGGNVLNHFRACTLYGEANVGYASIDRLLDAFDRVRLAAMRIAAAQAGIVPCAIVLPWTGDFGVVRGEQDALRSHERDGHCSGLVHCDAGRRWCRPDGSEVY